jgi:hypothetical protein
VKDFQSDERCMLVPPTLSVFEKGGDVMDNMWVRVGTQLLARVSGPMKFRLVLQPCMAAFFAIRSGLADARAGKPPYFWGLLSHPGQREAMIKDGWKSVGRVFILALVLDAVYQMIVLHFVYPGEMIIVAFILAILPYLILRGLVTRLARPKKAPSTRPADTPRLRKVS